MAPVNATARYLVRFSNNPVLLRAALVSGELDEYVAGNEHLPEELWWEMYSRKKIPAAVAVNLCSQRLNEAQLEHVYRKERRITPREAALRHNGVPESLTGLVIAAKWLTPQAAQAWLASGNITPDVLNRVGVISGRPDMAISVASMHPDSYSDAAVCQMLLDSYSDEFRLAPLPLPVLKVLDQRPGLAPMVLRQVLEQGPQVVHRPLLLAAGECRHQSGEVLDLLLELLTVLDAIERNDEGNARTVWHTRLVNDLAKGVVGHPNTPLERLDEFMAFFNQAVEGKTVGETSMQMLVRLRENCPQAVAGDWAGELPAAQEQTLATLAIRGIVRTPNGWHPRAAAARRGKPDQRPVKYGSVIDAWEQCEPLGDVPTASTRGFGTTWPAGPAANSAKYLDGVLADASPGVWETVFSLLPNWSQSAGDLAVAAKALDE